MTPVWRVKLPPGVRPPFEVYVNGVRQELGKDFQVRAGELVFGRELVRQKLGGWAWFLGFWGIGTYKRNDEIDVRYEVGGRPMVAHGLEVIPPGDHGGDRDASATASAPTRPRSGPPRA